MNDANANNVKVAEYINDSLNVKETDNEEILNNVREAIVILTKINIGNNISDHDLCYMNELKKKEEISQFSQLNKVLEHISVFKTYIEVKSD